MIWNEAGVFYLFIFRKEMGRAEVMEASMEAQRTTGLGRDRRWAVRHLYEKCFLVVIRYHHAFGHRRSGIYKNGTACPNIAYSNTNTMQFSDVETLLPIASCWAAVIIRSHICAILLPFKAHHCLVSVIVHDRDLANPSITNTTMRSC